MTPPPLSILFINHIAFKTFVFFNKTENQMSVFYLCTNNEIKKNMHYKDYSNYLSLEFSKLLNEEFYT